MALTFMMSILGSLLCLIYANRLCKAYYHCVPIIRRAMIPIYLLWFFVCCSHSYLFIYNNLCRFDFTNNGLVKPIS